MSPASFDNRHEKTLSKPKAHRRGTCFPCDVVAVYVRQMADEFALRAPVAFPEGMKRVHLAQVIRGPVAERLGP